MRARFESMAKLVNWRRKMTREQKKRGVRPKATSSDTEGVRIAWPKEHRIQWVVWRRKRQVDGIAEPESLDPRDAEVWLAKERDGLSLRQIAFQFWGAKDARAVSGVRRAILRVERRHPGTVMGGCIPRASESLLSRGSLAVRHKKPELTNRERPPEEF